MRQTHTKMHDTKCCGNCEYSKYDWCECEYICTNSESDNFGCDTSYGDSCEEFEVRE